MLTPVNTCPSCGFYGAMNQGIRINWLGSCREWTCMGCVSWAQEVLFSRGQQLDPHEFRAYQPPQTYYYLPA